MQRLQQLVSGVPAPTSLFRRHQQQPEAHRTPLASPIGLLTPLTTPIGTPVSHGGPTSLLSPLSSNDENKSMFRCRIELETDVLYKFRQYKMTVVVCRMWRVRSCVTSTDIARRVIAGSWLKYGSFESANCAKCCQNGLPPLDIKLISLPDADLHERCDDPNVTDILQFELTTRCTSSREHLRAQVVLLVTGINEAPPFTSKPISLRARNHKPSASRNPKKSTQTGLPTPSPSPCLFNSTPTYQYNTPSVPQKRPPHFAPNTPSMYTGISHTPLPLNMSSSNMPHNTIVIVTQKPPSATPDNSVNTVSYMFDANKFFETIRPGTAPPGHQNLSAALDSLLQLPNPPSNNLDSLHQLLPDPPKVAPPDLSVTLYGHPGQSSMYLSSNQVSFGCPQDQVDFLSPPNIQHVVDSRNISQLPENTIAAIPERLSWRPTVFVVLIETSAENFEKLCSTFVQASFPFHSFQLAVNVYGFTGTHKSVEDLMASFVNLEPYLRIKNPFKIDLTLPNNLFRLIGWCSNLLKAGPNKPPLCDSQQQPQGSCSNASYL
ncbi:hypothetical protein Pelo_17133 [Pelomyxa schiedti]|nr:hypothetical protein Pelo_17133 [Pelomyxa schiedti]